MPGRERAIVVSLCSPILAMGMTIRGNIMQRIATWLVALPVPDPDLQCELIAWAATLLWLANLRELAR